MEKKLLLKIKSKSVYTQVRSNSSTQTQIIQENPTIGQTGYMYTLPNQAIGKPITLKLELILFRLRTGHKKLNAHLFI